MKQWLHDFLSHPWVDCKEAADGADGRAECGKRGTSWGPSRYRYRKSATAAPSVTDVPVALPSLIFDFVLGTSPSWSPKVYALHGRTLYSNQALNRSASGESAAARRTQVPARSQGPGRPELAPPPAETSEVLALCFPVWPAAALI